ncbi:MAG: VWA domain-containing protein [Acidobacteriota bacterium]
MRPWIGLSVTHVCGAVIYLTRRGIFRSMCAVPLRGAAIVAALSLSLSLPVLAVQEGDRPAPPVAGEKFVHVRFVDGNGNSVRNLRLDELEAVTQDGEPLQLTRLIPPSVPYDIGLVMDVSPSTDEDINPIRQATSDFVTYFPLESRIMVLTFDDDVYVDCDWTTDRKQVDEAIWEYGLRKSGRSTILWDAIVASAEQKFYPTLPRTAMILFTDGVDTGSKVYDRDKAVRFLQGAGVLTYVIHYFSLPHYWRVYAPSSTGYPPDPNRLPPPGGGGGLGGVMIGGSDRDMNERKIRSMYDRAVGAMRMAGDAGGGGLFHLTALTEMPKAYEEIASELLDAYTIGFKAAARKTKEPVRKVRIRTTRPGVQPRMVKPLGYGQ